MKTVEQLLRDFPTGSIGLFVVFSRFEFAMKDTGYVVGNENEAKADWNRLAAKLGEGFFAGVAPSIPTLIRTPPKKQTVSGGSLDWKPRKPPANTQELLEAVRAVRNNLFHGGKSGPPDAARDEALIASATTVLTEILERDSDLQAVFDGWY